MKCDWCKQPIRESDGKPKRFAGLVFHRPKCWRTVHKKAKSFLRGDYMITRDLVDQLVNAKLPSEQSQEPDHDENARGH